MSSADRIPFILNEQYQSPDLNTLQNLWSRWLTDATYLRGKRDDPAVNTAQMSIAANYSVVIGGLEVRASGANIQIIAGGILQISPIAPVTDDPFTQTTLSFLVANEVMATPAPGADTWYLLQAEAADVDDPTVIVPIWNGAAFVPTPGQVKRVRREMVLTLKAGTATSIPTPDTNQVCIAGVFRPAGGGAVLNAHIVDMRPMLPGPRGIARDILKNRWATSALIGNPTTLVMDVRVMSQDGELAYGPEDGVAPTAFDPTTAAYKSFGSPAIAANQWWYLYLCPLPSFGDFLRPAHLYPSSVGQGVLVLSNVAPSTAWRRTNSASVAYPQPFTAHSCVTGRGVLVGMLKRNGANTGWKPMSCVGDRVQTAGVLGTWILLAGAAPPQPLFTTLGALADMIPSGAVAFDVQVVADSAGAGAATVTVQDPTALVQRYEQLAPTDVLDSSVVFEDVDLTRGQSYELDATAGAGDLAAYLMGFRF